MLPLRRSVSVIHVRSARLVSLETSDAAPLSDGQPNQARTSPLREASLFTDSHSIVLEYVSVRALRFVPQGRTLERSGAKRPGRASGGLVLQLNGARFHDGARHDLRWLMRRNGVAVDHNLLYI